MRKTNIYKMKIKIYLSNRSMVSISKYADHDWSYPRLKFSWKKSKVRKPIDNKSAIKENFVLFIDLSKKVNS